MYQKVERVQNIKRENDFNKSESLDAVINKMKDNKNTNFQAILDVEIDKLEKEDR